MSLTLIDEIKDKFYIAKCCCKRNYKNLTPTNFFFAT